MSQSLKYFHDISKILVTQKYPELKDKIEKYEKNKLIKSIHMDEKSRKDILSNDISKIKSDGGRKEVLSEKSKIIGDKISKDKEFFEKLDKHLEKEEFFEDESVLEEIENIDWPIWEDCSIDYLKVLLSQINDPEIRKENEDKLNSLIHMAQRNYSEPASTNYHYFYSKISELLAEFNDISNSVREEFLLHPLTFDLITRENLTDQELNKYKNELNKRKDEYIKKAKKKPYKNKDEEANELNECKLKVYEKIKSTFLDKVSSNIEHDKLHYILEPLSLDSIRFDDDYIERVSRVKSLKTVKNEGLEGLSVVLRIDIEYYEHIYESNYNDDGVVIGKSLKGINFPHAKETILQSMSFLLDNRVKVVLLLAEFGPKLGHYHPDFSMKYFYDFVIRENLVDQAPYFIQNVQDLWDLKDKLENDEIKDNSLIILENINFSPQECNFELETDPLLLPKNLKEGTYDTQNLKLYTKNKFCELLSKWAQIYINDSTVHFTCKYPSIINMLSKTKAMGIRLETQIQKITNFFLINSPNFMLVIGNNFDRKYEKDIPDDYIMQNLLILNSIMQRFKVIFIYGKLAIYFIHFIQKDYILDPSFKLNPVFNQLIKFILIRASLNNIEIILPEDGRILKKTEYAKFKEGLMIPDPDNYDSYWDYMKYIKILFKMEKKQLEIEAMNLDSDELAENEEYLKNKLNEEQKELLNNYRQKEHTIKFRSNSYIKNFVEKQNIKRPQKIFKTEYEIYKFEEYIYQNNLEFLEPTGHQPTLSNGQKLEFSEDGFIVDNEPYEFVDFGEKSYTKLLEYFNHMNCVMWLGSLSPSIIENLYDDYAKIVKTIYDRKFALKQKFNEEQAEEEKKLHESDLKAKRQLLNIFLQSKEAYELVRSNFLAFLAPPVKKYFNLIF